MRTHVTVLGWAHIFVNLIHLMVAALAAVGITFLDGVIALTGLVHALPISMTVGVFVVLVAAVVYIPGMIVGWGLLNYASWARILGILVSIFDLLHFRASWPLFILGIYGLIVLLNAQTAALFEERGAGSY